MTNTELLAKIKAEIERRREANKRQYHSSAGGMSWQRMCGEEDCLVELLSFLSTLESEKPSDKEQEVDLNGKVTFDNKTILRVETDEKKKRVLEIIGLEESCCNYPLNYENETDDCYYEEYNDRIYIDGNITFNQMREIVEYIENK